MPRINQEEFSRTETYQAVRTAADAAALRGETGFCGPVACALATGLPYEQVLEEVRALNGGSIRGGTKLGTFDAFFEAHGYRVDNINPQEFISKYPGVHKTALKNITTHHPDRFPAVWKDGETYLLFTARHVSACVDGVVHDWARGRAKRVWKIIRVTKR